MNRYFIVFIIFLIIVAVAIIGAVFFIMRSNQQSSLEQGGTSTTATLPTVPEPGGNLPAMTLWLLFKAKFLRACR